MPDRPNIDFRSGRTQLAALAVGAVAAVGIAAAVLRPDRNATHMTPYQTPRPRKPFLIMNPHSGDGKVEDYDLPQLARDLGAEVFLLEGDDIDIAKVARDAVADGADLLGVAGGDGTQAIVAGVAIEADVPFMVIAAGTRNHFALDLGLDRDDPSTCLDAIPDGEELRVDVGFIGDRVFVNNCSFGAYAAVIDDPEYRDNKAVTTLKLLPDLLNGEIQPSVYATAAERQIIEPQALLVSNNPYGTGDAAGLGTRARLDTGELGVLAIKVESIAQAVALLAGTGSSGLTALTATEVVVSADADQMPVGIDGEAVTIDSPVTLTIRPRALRVRVPRGRPGVKPPHPFTRWLRFSKLDS